jgi:hypothetical protein
VIAEYDTIIEEHISLYDRTGARLRDVDRMLGMTPGDKELLDAVREGQKILDGEWAAV